MNHVPRAEFEPILQYLAARPVQVTKYRTKVGDGRSQTYGIVGRRCVAPALSRSTCNNVELYSLLMDYAKRHVSIPFTSIQVNQNYPCKPHKDLHNLGLSYIVAFGDYTGGELVVEGVKYDIREKGFLFDGSQLTHWTEPWEGNRVSMVFHTLAPSKRWPVIQSLSEYEVVHHDGEWKILHTPTRALYWKGHTPAHPLKGLVRNTDV